MRWNEHSTLEGKHAFLSPSNYHWLNYSDERLAQMYLAQQAKIQGTMRHDLAKRCIELGVRLPDDGSTLGLYVNDAIDMGLKPEQPLYYSELCFGTADTIGMFDGWLHVHDLKTGKGTTSVKQTLIYAGLFFLEYAPANNLSSSTTPVECRIYQSDRIEVYQPTSDEVVGTINTIIRFDNIIRQIRMKGDLTWTDLSQREY